MGQAQARVGPPDLPGQAHGSHTVGWVWAHREDRSRTEFGSLLLLAPAAVLLLALFLVPSIYSGYLGLTNLELVGVHALDWHFTGSANLKTLVHDHTFWSSLTTTLYFVAGSIVGTVVVGLGLAMLMNVAWKGMRALVGTVVMIAWMLPTITAGITWYASTTANGTFAGMLHSPSLDLLHRFPLTIVTVANVWSQVGFAMLVLGAALRNISPEVVEAAQMEGATGLQRFRLVTLPLLLPTIAVVALLVALLSLANFALIYVMTQGGPLDATNILPLYSYQEAFQFDNIGYGAMIGNVLVVLCGILGVIYVRVLRGR